MTGMFQKAKLAALGLFLAGSLFSAGCSQVGVSQPSPKAQTNQVQRAISDAKRSKKEADKDIESLKKFLREQNITEFSLCYLGEKDGVKFAQNVQELTDEKQLPSALDFKVKAYPPKETQGRETSVLAKRHADPRKLAFKIVEYDSSIQGKESVVEYGSKKYHAYEMPSGDLILCPFTLEKVFEDDNEGIPTACKPQFTNLKETRRYTDLTQKLYGEISKKPQEYLSGAEVFTYLNRKVLTRIEGNERKWLYLDDDGDLDEEIKDVSKIAVLNDDYRLSPNQRIRLKPLDNQGTQPAPAGPTATPPVNNNPDPNQVPDLNSGLKKDK